ncbi:uncharacterized protein STAUR_6135 [Stigmatella aurantiaca DW4/3-1]|uniref:Uncharacterized protein n=1 Tax=Stigmatella aurantiaca (strain DW4/3-1) TaxID=378806 RepID=E3FEC2_STIAD|nr:uncharacterized protein STAUR_6135 [Stigmatella aurantiaca DW4/3-1]
MRFQQRHLKPSPSGAAHDSPQPLRPARSARASSCGSTPATAAQRLDADEFQSHPEYPAFKNSFPSLGT